MLAHSQKRVADNTSKLSHILHGSYPVQGIMMGVGVGANVGASVVQPQPILSDAKNRLRLASNDSKNRPYIQAGYS